jgi:hypothetical protein
MNKKNKEIYDKLVENDRKRRAKGYKGNSDHVWAAIRKLLDDMGDEVLRLNI